eukprot:2583398-Rhodomonas_salina.4
MPGCKDARGCYEIRSCSEMPDTDLVYAPTRTGSRWQSVAQEGRRCPLSYVIHNCYAMSGTNVGNATVQCTRYAHHTLMSVSDIA